VEGADDSARPLRAPADSAARRSASTTIPCGRTRTRVGKAQGKAIPIATWTRAKRRSTRRVATRVRPLAGIRPVGKALATSCRKKWSQSKPAQEAASRRACQAIVKQKRRAPREQGSADHEAVPLDVLCVGRRRADVGPASGRPEASTVSIPDPSVSRPGLPSPSCFGVQGGQPAARSGLPPPGPRPREARGAPGRRLGRRSAASPDDRTVLTCR
jgi:hypothetical protein